MTDITREEAEKLLEENAPYERVPYTQLVTVDAKGLAELARSVIQLHDELDRVRADAAAAVAMVVDRAAKHIVSEVERLAEGMQQTDPALEFLRELAAEVVTLASEQPGGEG